MRWAFIHALVIVLAWSLSAGALNADQEVLLDFIEYVPITGCGCIRTTVLFNTILCYDALVAEKELMPLFSAAPFQGYLAAGQPITSPTIVTGAFVYNFDGNLIFTSSL